MRTLALETSTNQGGVAITDGGRVLSRHIWARGYGDRDKSHSEVLTAALQTVLRQASLNPADLDQIAVGIGPGSFTGIRIAVNAARTLSYGLAKPLRAFDTLEILAEGARVALGSSGSERTILVLVNAHKNLMYASRFRLHLGALERLSSIEALTFEAASHLIETHACLGVGDGFVEWDSLWTATTRATLTRRSDVSDDPLPEILASLAERSSDAPLGWQNLQPLYVRPSEPEEKLRAGLLTDRSKINQSS